MLIAVIVFAIDWVVFMGYTLYVVSDIIEKIIFKRLAFVLISIIGIVGLSLILYQSICKLRI